MNSSTFVSSTDQVFALFLLNTIADKHPFTVLAAIPVKFFPFYFLKYGRYGSVTFIKLANDALPFSNYIALIRCPVNDI